MYDTPLEAALKAEIAQLRAENAWLRRGVDGPGETLRPWGVEEDFPLRGPLHELRLPLVGGVKGKLQADGRWSVIGWQERVGGDGLQVGYYTDGYNRKHIDDMTFVNHILPKCHERFVRALADILVKKMKP